ncbi:hypothetical protein EA187_19340 [Lujinxingia sediminis]|uniref:Lipoprotein n=1 Tax=Lujinxingia sediminis TaxID=2480984 RepID=A0ABY0CP12_9DELT|nr:hypothetical protein [Lujinxingia sediminis]RVU41057.1 hypothetical protein EA187_19340 [Lujinxingia sediminis]
MTHDVARHSLFGSFFLVAALGLLACDGEPAPGGDLQTEVDASQEPDSGESDAGEPDAEAPDGGDTGDVEVPGCDLEGFELSQDLQIVEGASGWSLVAEELTQMLSLKLSAEGGAQQAGTYTFEDAALRDQANSLLLAEGCSPAGCEAFFMAVGGTLEISAWDSQEGGAFEAELQDLELVEVALSEGTFVPVEEGLSWCLESLELMASSMPMADFPDAISCDESGFEEDVTLRAGTIVDSGSLIVELFSGESTPQNVLSLQLYGATEGALPVGTYALDDYNYASCERCLLIYAGCEGANCRRTFIAGSGELEIVSAGAVDGAYAEGERFEATLRQAKLAEVTIDPVTYHTTLVEGGGSWCVEELELEVTIAGDGQ